MVNRAKQEQWREGGPFWHKVDKSGGRGELPHAREPEFDLRLMDAALGIVWYDRNGNFTHRLLGTGILIEIIRDSDTLEQLLMETGVSYYSFMEKINYLSNLLDELMDLYLERVRMIPPHMNLNVNDKFINDKLQILFKKTNFLNLLKKTAEVVDVIVNFIQSHHLNTNEFLTFFDVDSVVYTDETTNYPFLDNDSEEAIYLFNHAASNLFQQLLSTLIQVRSLLNINYKLASKKYDLHVISLKDAISLLKIMDDWSELKRNHDIGGHESKDIDIRYSNIPNNLYFLVDAQVFAFIIQLFIRNARHGGHNVIVEFDHDSCELNLADSGRGIPETKSNSRDLSNGSIFAMVDLGIKVELSNSYSALDGTKYSGAHVALDLSNVVVGK